MAEYEAQKAKADDMQTLYDSTVTPNENLLEFIKALEKKMPSDVVVSGMNCTADSITFTCTASDYDVISKFLMQAKTIPCIKNISTDGITTDSDEGEKTSYSFTMNCQYADAAEVSAQ